MYIIGVTGGIACGKSTVSNELSKYGAKIINADKMAHWQLSPGGEIYNAYIEHFGSDILNEEGLIDRRKIAGIVFNDEEQLAWINEIAHPIILKHVRQRLVDYQIAGVSLVILDVPLLYEAGWDRECDEVWVVHLKHGRQVNRLMERNKLTLEEAEGRIKAQISGKERRKRADVVIDNNGFKSSTQKQIKRLIRRKFPHLIRNYSKFKQKQIQEQIERLLGIE
ncbi:MAG: dephospho-CoA kinase [Selenomonadaceae bacterium]|nr:dephospho-CoA kinase [Selenomonadaceae bacterium]